jgi:predicted NBD/HSP70 family sugar kinase
MPVGFLSVAAASRREARSGARLLGIGVGLPGAVDPVHGILESAPDIAWRHVDVGQRLARELAAVRLGDVPVCCQNEADPAAIGETSFGSRPVDDPLVYISRGVGVGAGIVLDGALSTGATGTAGEIGHTILHVGGLPCSCGRRDCAEAYVGGAAFALNALPRPYGRDGVTRVDALG